MNADIREKITIEYIVGGCVGRDGWAVIRNCKHTRQILEEGEEDTEQLKRYEEKPKE
jgi:hypothetical protein